MNDQRELIQKIFSEGVALLQAGSAEEALFRFQETEKYCQTDAAVYLYTGAALHALQRYEEAAARYRKAIGISPQMGEAYNNLGNSMMALGHFAAAVESFAVAARLLPASPVPLTAGASALQAVGLVQEAEAVCRSVLAFAPDFAEAHWNLALNLLLQGRYQEGWQEYEWRWRKPDFTSPRRHADIPLWDGSELNGSTIILHAEQGFGDAIQFVRYAPLVAQRGGRVILECHPELVTLFLTVEGVETVIPFDAPMPPCSCQAPLLSLPRIFETTLRSIPSHTPYVRVSPDRIVKWAALISTHQATGRVGLIWSGKAYPDPLRSCRLADLAALGGVADATFFSLQVGAVPSKPELPSGMQLVDLTANIHDFADTAALIEQLDVVVSIDTAGAHLAAALGKPVFLMVPCAPDWRWMLERSDSPWYANMHIFRQEQQRDWSSTTEHVKDTLKKFFYRAKKNPSK